jgi:hypothetical protein
VLQAEALENAAVAALAQAAAGAVRTARAEPRVLTAAELEARDVPEPGFVVENLLTGPGAWALIGSHKAGKTVFAAQLALSYQAGVPFLDYYRMLESRPALFIEQDDPLRELALRDILRRTPIADRRGFFVIVYRLRVPCQIQSGSVSTSEKQGGWASRSRCCRSRQSG